MGNCLALPIKQQPTLIENLRTQLGIIRFEVSRLQKNASLICGVILTILNPQASIFIKLSQMHPQRQICIDVCAIADQYNVEIQRNTKIQYRLAYQYSDYIVMPTKVMFMNYCPGNTIQISMRLTNNSLTKAINKCIHNLDNFQQPFAKYYHDKQTIFNILILGSVGTGKSSYLQQITQIIFGKYQNPYRVQIGSNLQLSTTHNYFSCPIISNTNHINLIDSPGINQLLLYQLPTYLQGKYNSNVEDYTKIIHSVIVFIDVSNVQSIRIASKIIKILTNANIQYTVAITHWDAQMELYEQYFIKKCDKDIQAKIKQQGEINLTEMRTFPISNLQSSYGNNHAKLMALYCLSESVKLASHFYSVFPPIHIMVDHKIISINHRIANHLTFNEFMVLTDLEAVVKYHGYDLMKLYVQKAYLANGYQRKGLILLQKVIQRTDDQSIECYITLEERQFRLFKLFTEVPFFSNEIK